MRNLAFSLSLALAWAICPNVSWAVEETVLHDGFDGSDFTPEGGLYYRENFEQSAGEVVFQSKIIRSGEGALQLSVRPLCPPHAEGCSERAEIWERTGLRVPYDKGVWYGFSMRFDDPVPVDDHRYVMAQWKREIGPEADGDFSPFLALRMRSGVMFATVETNFVAPPPDAPRPEAGQCPAGWAAVWLRPETRQMRVLVARAESWSSNTGPEFDHCTDAVTINGPAFLPEATAEWHDYAFYTLPGPNGGGMIHIVVDGASVVTVSGRIGHDDIGLGANQYFKFGPYRDAGEGKWSLYYDSFVRAPDCDKLLPADLCKGLE
ncbi:polysaccharide lyase [Paracoccus sp. MBLB3053]|uniref:Polysaccharide lyase n=1 Tax=Paracoccus aurantius TaxID=3073814 RepID=A0ABU2HYE8_9RHOB|nr:polysaccharide lyase [Paracoccus sp. MBLB3053]MDS9470081.1 polysaccharide lyase [Paracoccus sp. MBLB3053]